MKDLPSITDAEWEVMRVLWKKNPITSLEIIDDTKHMNWHKKTVRTLISRLVDKKAITFDKKEKIYYYQPLVEEKDCVTNQTQTLLDRLFGGSLTPMVAHFVESKKLTKDELQEIKRVLDKKNEGEKNE